MRYLRVLFAALIIITALLTQQTKPLRAACNGFSIPSSPFAFEKLTVSNSVIPFTVATYATATRTANYATVYVETNPVRFRVDGGNPTAGTTGIVAAAGSTIEVCGSDAVKNFRVIREGAADASAQTTYYSGF